MTPKLTILAVVLAASLSACSKPGGPSVGEKDGAGTGHDYKENVDRTVSNTWGSSTELTATASWQQAIEFSAKSIVKAAGTDLPGYTDYVKYGGGDLLPIDRPLKALGLLAKEGVVSQAQMSTAQAKLKTLAITDEDTKLDAYIKNWQAECYTPLAEGNYADARAKCFELYRGVYLAAATLAANKSQKTPDMRERVDAVSGERIFEEPAFSKWLSGSLLVVKGALATQQHWYDAVSQMQLSGEQEMYVASLDLVRKTPPELVKRVMQRQREIVAQVLPGEKMSPIEVSIDDDLGTLKLRQDENGLSLTQNSQTLYSNDTLMGKKLTLVYKTSDSESHDKRRGVSETINTNGSANSDAGVDVKH